MAWRFKQKSNMVTRECRLCSTFSYLRTTQITQQLEFGFIFNEILFATILQQPQMVADQRTARWKISACLSSVTSPFLCAWGAVAAGTRLSRGGRWGHRACVGRAASGDCKRRTKERPLAAPSPFTCGRAPGHSTQAPLPAHGSAGWHRAHPVLPAGCSPRSPPRRGWCPWEGEHCSRAHRPSGCGGQASTRPAAGHRFPACWAPPAPLGALARPLAPGSGTGAPAARLPIGGLAARSLLNPPAPLPSTEEPRGYLGSGSLSEGPWVSVAMPDECDGARWSCLLRTSCTGGQGPAPGIFPTWQQGEVVGEPCRAHPSLLPLPRKVSCWGSVLCAWDGQHI